MGGDMTFTLNVVSHSVPGKVEGSLSIAFGVLYMSRLFIILDSVILNTSKVVS